MALPYLHQLLYRSGYLCHLYLKPPPLTWPALCHFTFIFQQNFFRVPISRKISFKCNKMQCRCHKSIPLDCRRRRRGGRRTSQRRKIEMHWHWKINNKRVAKVAQRASIFGIGIFIMYVYGKFCRFVNAEIKYFQKSKQNNKKPKKKKYRNQAKRLETISKHFRWQRTRADTATQPPHSHRLVAWLSLFAHESMLHTLRQQAKRV